MTEASWQRRRPFLSEVSRVVPGLYGWLATVLTPVLQRGASIGARVFALMALLALVGSFLFAGRRQRLSRALGVYGFISCCFLAWALLGPLLRSDQLDAVRGALGAIGFLLHALAWGAVPREPDPDALDNLVPGNPLQPRNKPGRFGAVVLGLGIAVSLVPMVMAFSVERPSASLLAQAVALGCGLLVIGASSDVSLRVGKAHEQAAWRPRAARAIWPLGALAVAFGVAMIWLALR
jgi:hypothetical protein